MSGAAFAILLLGAIHGAVAVADRSEARVRSTGGSEAVDLETSPAMLAELRAPWWTLSAHYFPRLIGRDLNISPAADLLHRGSLLASFLHRRGSISILADGAYGTQTYTSLAVPLTSDASAPSVDPLPAASSLRYGAIHVGLSSRFVVARRTNMELGVEYAASGGMDAASQSALAFQQGPRASASLSYQAGRRDRLVSTLSAARVLVSTGMDSGLVEVSETWHRALARSTDASLGVGIAGLRNVLGIGAPASFELLPMAEASIRYRLRPMRFETGLDARLAPVVDRLRGVVDERLQVSGNAAWTPATRLTLHTRLGVAQSVPFRDLEPLSLMLGELGATLRIADPLQIEAGMRGAFQRFGENAWVPQWVAFAALTVAAPAFSF